MTELKLFMDPYDIEYPSLVKEVLSQGLKKVSICATLTPHQQCLLVCGNVMYIWTCTNKNRGLPHAFRLNLPGSGLKYSTDLVCIFKRTSDRSTITAASSSAVCVLAVSPEGCVRYWSEVGKPHSDHNISLQNDVALSVSLIEALGHVDRFLVSTATANFHIVEIFHSSSEQSERIAIRALEMDSPDGIGRRMSKMLFGYAAEKESVLKTIFVKGQLKAKEVDIAAILPRSLRFFSITNRSLLHEANIPKMFVDTLLNQGADNKKTEKDVTVLDAALYRKGILLLLAIIGKQTNIQRNAFKVDFYLAFLENKREPASLFTMLVPIILPDNLVQMETRKLSKCKLFVPNGDECVVVLPKSLILIRHPTSGSVHAAILEEIDDLLLGAACVNGLCHVILKETGVCALRRLPPAFDLSFWKKYNVGLQRFMDESFTENSFKEAFVVFCSKDLPDSQELVNELMKKSDINYSELAVEIIRFFVDRPPIDDPRWGNDGHFPADQKQWLKEHSGLKNLPLIVEQLDDKYSQYKMLVLFLQHFNILDKMDVPVQSVQSVHNRSGLTVLAEVGEKLVLMMLCARWLSENSAPFITESFKTLGSEFARRFNHPENAYLTPFDHVFNEVFTFHELIPALVKASEKELKESRRDSDAYERVIREVTSFLSVVASGVADIQHEGWSLKMPPGSPTWLNHSQFLTHFIRHLNTVLDFLADKYDSDTTAEMPPILDETMKLAKFVLSQQTRWQRDNSRIIAKFYDIGRTPDSMWIEIALRLAEEFQDFTRLIEYCHKNLDEKNCRRALDEYKKKYDAEEFELFLYEYYREKGMVNYLLAEKGKRLNEYLSAHENINWIKNIDNGDYKQARRTLKSMAFVEKDPSKKLVELSLCKLCALCEDETDVAELVDLSENIRALSENS